MSVGFDDTDLFFTKCELALNPIDRIPFISIFSAAIRMTASKAMIVVSAILATGFGLASLIDNQHSATALQFLKYVAHGFANLCRASVAFIPFINLSLWVYDDSNRFRYDAEVRQMIFP